MVLEAVAKSQIRLLPEGALLNLSASNDYQTLPGKAALAVDVVTVPPFAAVPLWHSDNPLLVPVDAALISFSEMAETFRQRLSRGRLPGWGIVAAHKHSSAVKQLKPAPDGGPPGRVQQRVPLSCVRCGHGCCGACMSCRLSAEVIVQGA